MDPMAPALLGIMIPIVAILGGICVAITAIISKSRVRQLQIRERIAMIEKGLVPPPATDPAGFDRAMGRLDREWAGVAESHLQARIHGGAGRHRRAGVTLIGVGLGLILLISFAGEEPRTAIGVGGFLAIIGLAFLINSLFEKSAPAPATTAGAAPPDTPVTPES